MIAFDIIEGISAEGYFQEDSELAAKRLEVSVEEYEKRAQAILLPKAARSGGKRCGGELLLPARGKRGG